MASELEPKALNLHFKQELVPESRGLRLEILEHRVFGLEDLGFRLGGVNHSRPNRQRLWLPIPSS